MKRRLNLCSVVLVLFIFGVGYAAAQTPLIEAAKAGDTEKVRTLLENGADVNAKTTGGFTALSEAKKEGHEEIVRILRSNLHPASDITANNNQLGES